MSALNNQERKLDRLSDSLLIKRLEQAEKNFEEQQKQLTKMLQDLAEVKTKMEMEVKSKQASEQSLEAKIVEARNKLKEELEELREILRTLTRENERQQGGYERIHNGVIVLEEMMSNTYTAFTDMIARRDSEAKPLARDTYSL